VIPPHDGQSLEDLVAQCQEGNPRAFEALVRKLDQDVRDLVSRRGIRDADVADVTSETWLKVWRNIPLFNFESSFKTWLYRIAVNASNDWHRRRRREPELMLGVELQEEMDDDPAIDDIGVAWSERKEILLALGALKPDLRDAVVLVDGHGLTLGEAANVLGVNYKTLASRLSRGRRAFMLAFPRSLSDD
jgi:RNA polymerase sigma-70 factor (ECF subfamily)